MSAIASEIILCIPHNDAKNMGVISVETLKSGSDVLFILLQLEIILACEAFSTIQTVTEEL